MKRNKRKPSLPRVTVLAMSKRDLLAWVEAQAALAHLVRDLAVQVERLTLLSFPARPKKKLPLPADIDQE
jgi:hypothetical protein